MAHDAIEHKDSDFESEAEVSQTHEQLLSEVNELNDCLLKQDNDNLIKKAARERSELKAELEKALEQIVILKSAPSVEDVSECEEYAVHMACPTSLQTKHASVIDELDIARNALEEVKTRPVLLGAYKTCPALQIQYDDAYARIKDLEKSISTAKSKIPVCDVCPVFIDELNDLRLAKQTVEDENTYLHTVLSWVSSSEPQLGIMIK